MGGVWARGRVKCPDCRKSNKRHLEPGKGRGNKRGGKKKAEQAVSGFSDPGGTGKGAFRKKLFWGGGKKVTVALVKKKKEQSGHKLREGTTEARRARGGDVRKGAMRYRTRGGGGGAFVCGRKGKGSWRTQLGQGKRKKVEKRKSVLAREQTGREKGEDSGSMAGGLPEFSDSSLQGGGAGGTFSEEKEPAATQRGGNRGSSATP